MKLSLNILIFVDLIFGSFQQLERSLPNLNDCGGFESENFRIYNGKNAKIYEHPWYALIEINFRGNKLRCGGSLINPLFVVSAAHCFEKLPRETLNGNITEVKVTLGEHDTEKDSDCEEGFVNSCYNTIEMEVERIIMHSDYKGKSTSFINDIALLELKWTMIFDTGSSLMRPICLPINGKERYINLFKNGTVTGFGRTENGSLSEIKKKADLNIISTEECQRYFNGTKFKLKKNSASSLKIKINGAVQVCAVGLKNEDTCNGDSGGPFVVSDKYLIGIVSFGPEDCGNGIFPAVFTRVSFYVDWIVENMQANINV